MTVIDVQTKPSAGPSGEKVVVNDFSINVASPNGSGSQTSNLSVIRALFDMGVPVNGKNLFPSNIQGLPTWYIIRLNADGYLARKDTSEVLVAWNQQTFAKDVAELPSGSVLLFPLDWKQVTSRNDLHIFRIPINEIMKGFDIPRQIKTKVANMVYVGGLAYLLGIELDAIERALGHELKGKQKAIDLNQDVVKAAYQWATENWDISGVPYRAERMDDSPNTGKFLMEGNSAAGLGAAFGGCTFMAWYPITPSTSVIDAARGWFKHYRHREDGRPSYAIIQAEDELAALGMVIGAGWAGARAMTATSGPGISLMAEFTGLSYFAEIPAVVWNVQRMGPSTGLPTRTSQGDVMFTHFLGHGDSRHPVLLPADPKEAFEFGWRAFDYAEQFQTILFVLSDLDLGMNLWTSDDFEYPDAPLDRGKVLHAEDLTEPGKWGRYKDVDGDGIAYRTLPGTPSPYAAYFARGTGHDEYGVYTEDSDAWEQNMERITRKIEGTRDALPAPILDTMEGATVGILSYGTNHPAIVEARDLLAAQGLKSDYMRIRALPLAHAVHDFVNAYDHVYVVENNHDAQMAQILRLDMPAKAAQILPVNKCDGLPLTARFISESILQQEG
ncbi:MAG: 2-oxoacid:acceptor oxidoreductase subunit alpha [Anaerolineales bacterium]